MSDSYYLGIGKDKIVLIDAILASSGYTRNETAAELRERADSQATPAAREYSNLYDEVSSLMALAAELVDDHAVMVTEDSNPPTWEHVGDMKHARQLIKQLVAFLSPDGE